MLDLDQEFRNELILLLRLAEFDELPNYFYVHCEGLQMLSWLADAVIDVKTSTVGSALARASYSYSNGRQHGERPRPRV